MERVKSISHDGKHVLLLDLSYAGKEDILVTFEEAKKNIRNQPQNSVLTLTNVHGARYDEEIVRTLKEFTKENMLLLA